MKIRKGFVSNSSSSSFVLVGYKISPELAKELLGVYDIEDTDDFYENMEKLIKVLNNKLGRKVHLVNEYDNDYSILIGLGEDIEDGMNLTEIKLEDDNKDFFERLYCLLYDNTMLLKPSVFYGSRMC